MDFLIFEEVLKLFILLKVLGIYKEEDVLVGVGWYGFYVWVGLIYVFIFKGEDLF